MDLLTTYSLTTIIASMLFAFSIAFPIIELLYYFKIFRKMDVDFTTLIEKRNLKVGVPIMGGLIVVLTVLIINTAFNPLKTEPLILITLLVFLLSALLGGFDDVLNIYGKDRAKLRTISRTLKLIKVHKSIWKRMWLAITFPWTLYKRFFFVLGSNPGKGIQAHEKIIVQSIAGFALGFGIYEFLYLSQGGPVNVPIFDYTVELGWAIIPFVWIAVVLMANAVNLADGMDGLASGGLLAAFIAYLIIAIDKGDESLIFLISTVVGALIVYIYFNVPPARFQMGDVGSLSMGTLLAAVAFILEEPLLLLVIAFPFVLTLLSAVIQGLGRRILGRRIFRMAPIHYHFQMFNEWSEEKVVMRFWLLSIFCAFVGLWMYFI